MEDDGYLCELPLSQRQANQDAVLALLRLRAQDGQGQARGCGGQAQRAAARTGVPAPRPIVTRLTFTSINVRNDSFCAHCPHTRDQWAFPFSEVDHEPSTRPQPARQRRRRPGRRAGRTPRTPAPARPRTEEVDASLPRRQAPGSLPRVRPAQLHLALPSLRTQLRPSMGAALEGSTRRATLVLCAWLHQQAP